MITILDGPVGTELTARGVSLSGEAWSAFANASHPEVIAAIHRDYAAAGATVHCANTFRTRFQTVGEAWVELTHRAVELVRENVAETHRIAGSIAPLHDCYRPDLSPGAAAFEAHAELANELVAAGCDLLLCETHMQIDEAEAATKAAVATGIETWLALTAGPNTDLLTPQQMVAAANRAVQQGATAILVNCTPAVDTLRFVDALAAADLNVALGAYANAGSPDDALGWDHTTDITARRYAAYANQWVKAGATLIGGCCGTGPKHIAALKEQP